MSTWHDQLDTWGAVREASGAVAHFGDYHQELRNAVGAATLTMTERLARIRISGRDHREFLQAQLTSDVLSLSPNQTQTSAWLTPKGQVRCVLDLLVQDASIDAIVPAEGKDALIRALSMFVLRAKVNLTDVTDAEPMLGLVGPTAPANVMAQLKGAVDEGMSSPSQRGVTYWRLPGGLPRFLLTGTPDNLVFERQALTTVPLAGNEAWHLASVQAGIPHVTAVTAERYIPQMLNLDELGAVSFEKGCYPGQEIVARTRYLGRLKRRLYRGQISGRAPELLGTLNAQSGAGEKQGEIIDYAPTPDAGIWSVLSVANVTLGRAAVDVGGAQPPVEMTLQPVDHGSEPV